MPILGAGSDNPVATRPVLVSLLRGAATPVEPSAWLSTKRWARSFGSDQDLTTAGGYIEMTSRYAAPVLLGLAIRGRVKRGK
ncbi:hypothetical protein GCM10010510_32020 [Streptomyces anandii JCM 4720]|nr:hypothetical protein GCM10010510_32020 [Streptomyces anandii JCM 4720]